MPALKKINPDIKEIICFIMNGFMIESMEEIDQASPPRESNVAGSVIEANITDDVIRVKITSSPENAEIGVPYMIEGDKYFFFCMSTNIIHESKPIVKEIANTRIFDAPIPHTMEDAGAMQPQQWPAILELSCLKVIAKDGHETKGFKTIPNLFSKARVATSADIQMMSEDLNRQDHTISAIGKFVGMDVDVPIDLSALFEVPFGIFGKTGKGKTVTAKSLVIKAGESGCTVNGKIVQFIIFDAQGEYARGTGSSAGSIGLNQIIPGKFYQLSIDPGTAEQLFLSPLYIDPSKINVEDWINFMQHSNPSVNMEIIIREIDKLRTKDARDNGIHDRNKDLPLYLAYLKGNATELERIKEEASTTGGTFSAIYRRMLPFNDDKFRQSFLRAPPEGYANVSATIKHFLQEGKSIIIHFGRFSVDKDVYSFVTNYIVRNLYNLYSSAMDGKFPHSNTIIPHVVLLVEEAHRFVPSATKEGIGGSSYFQKIARETRKFGLVLGLIDQRPSKIDDEITSQLNSRIIHRLDDQDDVKAALAGLNKTKWIPIASKLGIGEGLFFGDVVGDVPTMIKPFWSHNIRAIKDYYGCADIPLSALMTSISAVIDDEISDPDLDSLSNPSRSSMLDPVPAAPVPAGDPEIDGFMMTKPIDSHAKKPSSKSKKPGNHDEKKVDVAPGIERRRSINLGDTSDAT